MGGIIILIIRSILTISYDYFHDELINLSPYTDTDVISADLPFICEPYKTKDVIYFEYRDNKYNDKYRTNCYSSKNQENIIETYDYIKDKVNPLITLERIEINDMEVIKLIVIKYNELFSKFIQYMYLPEKYVTIISSVILDKCIFMVIGKHLEYFLLYEDENSPIVYDFIAQFNRFLFYY